MGAPRKPITKDFNDMPDEALIRLAMLLALNLLPFSASTLWRKVRRGAFPAPIKVSPNVTAWRVRNVRAWLADPATYANAQNMRATRGPSFRRSSTRGRP